MRNLLWVVLIILGGSCASDTRNMESASDSDYVTGELAEEVSTENAKIETKADLTDRKLIWKADISFQVQNVDSSTKHIQNLVNNFSGFVSSMNLTTTNYKISNTLKIRIGNEHFEKLIGELKKGALYVDELRIESNDVTEEFVDIESRLKTKKEVRERYIDILRDKAGTVKDVIQAEDAIREITEEIEAKEGRLRYLKNQVNLSTITLTIYQKVNFKEEPEIYEKPYFKKFVEALKNGWSIITIVVLFLANIWPILLIIGFIYLRRNWILKKFNK